MNWTAYVDGYCERTAPGLWGEPLNDLANLAFLAAAGMVWWRADGQRAGRVLAALIGLIFVASGVFHLVATRWGAVADSTAILIFTLFYAAAFPRIFFPAKAAWSWLGALAFLAITGASAALGGGLYLPALAGLAGFAIALGVKRDSYWLHFTMAAAVFALSLSFRAIDGVICGDFPAGTHFLWHVLNAVVLYIVAKAMIGRTQETSAPETDAEASV
ncbi:hypothetical protein G3I59_14850 [Amycolatopsis rubida]|uniref:Ceramidase n=1 Tax=Amycolatopsis rubida TaxID=112413 RepID=A0ABX0BMG0_9PSEU|nr:hypothetical protein [Amycolatopsis sp. M39]MYW91841.1 hypothetical protein [Amycolatopsis rubida]NEC56826.1 hypothetical protein [Amycolatopsis rubida]OAP28007.1 hypothetical protein A4R44_01617 [Amycolatopsis sp. M39]